MTPSLAVMSMLLIAFCGIGCRVLRPLDSSLAGVTFGRKGDVLTNDFYLVPPLLMRDILRK